MRRKERNVFEAKLFFSFFFFPFFFFSQRTKIRFLIRTLSVGHALIQDTTRSLFVLVFVSAMPPPARRRTRGRLSYHSSFLSFSRSLYMPLQTCAPPHLGRSEALRPPSVSASLFRSRPFCSSPQSKPALRRHPHRHLQARLSVCISGGDKNREEKERRAPVSS